MSLLLFERYFERVAAALYVPAGEYVSERPVAHGNSPAEIFLRLPEHRGRVVGADRPVEPAIAVVCEHFGDEAAFLVDKSFRKVFGVPARVPDMDKENFSAPYPVRREFFYVFARDFESRLAESRAEEF